MERWRGRVALVTGASKGIGAGIVRCLASHGLKVVACARTIDQIQETAEELSKSNSPGEVFPLRCNVRNEAEILSVFQQIRERYGRIDICINNAGVMHMQTLADGNTDNWREMFEVNVLGLSICTREAIRMMREKDIDDGQIIHISSLAGHKVPIKEMSFYASTKHAVRALTEGLRMELQQAGSRIRIASVSPGLVTTDMAARAIDQSIIPTFKALEVSDIEDAVIYILSAKPHVQVHDVLIRSVEALT